MNIEMTVSCINTDIIAMNLNARQKYAFDQIRLGRNVFITGAGGVGKSYLIECVVKWLKETKYVGEKNAVAVTSTTGASALLIGGKTIHSFSGIGLGKDSKEKTMEKLEKNWFVKKRWQKTRVLIIDEISMLTPTVLELIEYVARKCRYRDHLLFGGIQVILSGDFAQLPPINIKEFCFESTLWSTLIEETIYLTEIVRQSDPALCRALNEIRLGECSDETEALFLSRIDAELTNDFGILPTKLYGHNYKVDAINDKYLQALISAGKRSEHYVMHVKIDKMIDTTAIRPVIDRIVKECAGEESLVLAEGAQVMLTVNYNTDCGLANGTRGIIERFDVGGMPVVRFLNGAVITVDKYVWEFDLDVRDAKIKITQVPLRLAYAMTIHRGQGASLDYVETSIDNGIFEYGQAYVVLSRVRNLDGLTLTKFDKSRIKANERVVSYYKELDLKNRDKRLLTDYFDYSTTVSFSTSSTSTASSTASASSTSTTK